VLRTGIRSELESDRSIRASKQMVKTRQLGALCRGFDSLWSGPVGRIPSQSTCPPIRMVKCLSSLQLFEALEIELWLLPGMIPRFSPTLSQKVLPRSHFVPEQIR
jgi:hypothetical protein